MREVGGSNPSVMTKRLRVKAFGVHLISVNNRELRNLLRRGGDFGAGSIPAPGQNKDAAAESLSGPGMTRNQGTSFFSTLLDSRENE